MKAIIREQFPGTAAAVQCARTFIADALGGRGRADDAVLLVSELATNAVRHTVSGAPGGVFEVDVLVDGACVHVEVHDGGGSGAPCVRARDDDAMNGRGVAIMEALADRWGYYRDEAGAVVWFELDSLAA
ncbi:ATP-binding protein [Microbispora sp. NPDC049125]|uniref:ATP-binding protein n=1 Tax=Microbispora sp. NPDC049125 TaxID=3154929 RepID=UPI003467E6C3